MKVELLIQNMFDHAPSIIRTRKDALYQLFCLMISANGFVWRKGRLEHINSKDVSLQRDLKQHLVDGKAFQHQVIDTDKKLFLYYADDDDVDNKDFWLELAKSVDEETVFRVSHSIFEGVITQPYIDNAYQWKSIALFDYPDDIKDDFRAAIEECREYLKEDGIVLPDEQED